MPVEEVEADRGRARRFRMRAEELRVLSEQAVTAETRLLFWNLAESYDKLADDFERRAHGEVRPQRPTG